MKNSEIISEEEYNKKIKKISTRLSKPLFEPNKKFVFLDEDEVLDDDETEVVYVIPRKATEKELDESTLQKRLDQELRKEELETLKSIEEREKKLKQVKKTRKKSNFLVIVENQALLNDIQAFLQNKRLNENEQMRIIKDISFVQNRLRQVENSATRIEKGINTGSIQIIEFKEYKELKNKLANLSPLAWLGPKKEPISNQEIEDLKKTLLKKQFRLHCLYCNDYSAIFTIASVNEKPKCKKCQSRYLGVSNIDDEKMKETLSFVKQKKTLSKDKKKIWNRIQKSATQMLDYGKIALIAMAANGIGTINTQKILQKKYDRKGEDEIYKIILELRR